MAHEFERKTLHHLPSRFVPSRQMMKQLLGVTLLGGGIFVVGLIVAPDRIWPNFLLASYYFISLALGSALFMALQYVSNAGWSVALRRVPEAVTATLPAAGLGMLITMLGIHTLYAWSNEAILNQDAILHSKAGWLNIPFFIGRTVFYLLVWLGLGLAMVKISQRQDQDGQVDFTARNKRYAALFIVAFGFTITLASMDWIMSLEPHWYSTIFGIYNFSGLFLTALATITVLVILLKRMGPFQHVVHEGHLHSLGKLIFAFSTFWMYIWFSQYLLIWYANIPEEVTYFIRRQHGSWIIFTVINVLFNWFIPFIVLLPAWTKKNEGVLLRVCIIIMIGHWIDLFWMIMPPFMPNAPYVNVWEIGPFAGIVALFFYLTFRALSKVNVIPVKDPLLAESLAQH